MTPPFKPGQLAKLNMPELGARNEWRYIILSEPFPSENTGWTQYLAYCFRSPGYRPESLGKLTTVLECHLVLDSEV